MKRPFDGDDDELDVKRQKTDDESMILPWHQTYEHVFNVMRFMRGRELNNIKRVCSFWYDIQSSDYFIQEHVKDMKLKHDEIDVEEQKTQTKSIQMWLGYKQGLMTITDKRNNYVKGLYNYKNGKREGHCIDYSKTGRTISEGHYKEGKKHGRFVKYFSKNPDIIEHESHYADNKLDGKLSDYLLIKDKTTGQMKVVPDSVCEYKNGKLHGTKHEYDKDHCLSRTVQYKNGKIHGKVIRYFKGTDDVEYECEFVDGKQHGKEVLYFINGNPFETKYFEKGSQIQETLIGGVSRLDDSCNIIIGKY
jgi:antitoxin component YwqK of YwqJK toxin-antitoxin module